MMFVKWAKRKWVRRSRVSLDAILVKNRWIKGKVKQEYLGYLASIRQDHIGLIHYLIVFWRKVEGNLSRLKLTPQEKRVANKSIQKKIRKPSATEVQEHLKLTKLRIQQRIARKRNKK
jgi:hypothetical protein